MTNRLLGKKWAVADSDDLAVGFLAVVPVGDEFGEGHGVVLVGPGDGVPRVHQGDVVDPHSVHQAVVAGSFREPTHVDRLTIC